MTGLSLAAIAVLVRIFAAAEVDRIVGEPTAPKAWLSLRDLLYFTVYLASFGARRIEWRGERLRMAADGRIAAEPAE